VVEQKVRFDCSYESSLQLNKSISLAGFNSVQLFLQRDPDPRQRHLGTAGSRETRLWGEFPTERLKGRDQSPDGTGIHLPRACEADATLAARQASEAISNFL
jgi:hypothetical protein